MSKLFLKARWEHLLLITYKVDPVILAPHLSKGLELDTIDNSAFLSVVGFNFLDTAVKGLKVPFHVNFPEINLRFYVKESSPPNPSPKGRGEVDICRRGVVFIREFVPRYFISLFANMMYNENYRAVSMESNLHSNNDKVFCSYGLRLNGNSYNISVEAENKLSMPDKNSAGHFFKEHEWGFGATRRGETLVYRVEHPFWEVFPLVKFNNTIDFAEVYGEKWRFLNNEKPYNVTFAKGSEIKVFSAEKM